MPLRPLHDHVLVKPAKEQEVSKGGIHIPERAKEKSREGVVVAVGSGMVLDNGKVVEPSVKKGDKVLFARHAGNEIVVDDEKHQMMREGDILAVIE